MSVSIYNINGVIKIFTTDSTQGYRYYYGSAGTSGKFYPSIKENDEFQGFLINIGGDSYEIKWQDLIIDGTAPENLIEAQSLLTILFTS